MFALRRIDGLAEGNTIADLSWAVAGSFPEGVQGGFHFERDQNAMDNALTAAASNAHFETRRDACCLAKRTMLQMAEMHVASSAPTTLQMAEDESVAVAAIVLDGLTQIDVSRLGSALTCHEAPLLVTMLLILI